MAFVAPPIARAQNTMRAAPTSASDSARAVTDSLAERLRRAEEAIELLRQQLATQAEQEVHTVSRTQFEIFGRVLTNGFYNSGRVNVVDVPGFVLPDAGSALPRGSVSGAIRQSLIGGSVSVRDVLGGRFTGDMTVDLFGATQSNPSRTFPQLRLRTARGVLTWRHAEVLVGQDNPLVMGLNPVSIASVGIPDFVNAGNLWLWLPQFRVGADVGERVRVGVQLAVLAPGSGEAAGANDPDPADIAERSKRPFVQARLHVKWGADERAGDVGIGLHRGWYATTGDSLLTSEAVAADAKVPIGRWLQFRAEAYRGKLLRGLGGGGISQNFGQPATPDGVGVPIRDRGARAQLDLRPVPLWEIGAGCGIDDPDDDDRPVRLKNVACEGHAIVRPAGPLVVGLEYRHLATTYASGVLKSEHVNLAVGFEF